MRSASLPQLPGGLPSTNVRRVPRKPSISDTFRHRLAPATPVDHSWATPEPKRASPVWNSLEEQPRTWTPCGELHAWTSPGPRAWLKERLLEAEDTGSDALDALSAYVMRKHNPNMGLSSLIAHVKHNIRGHQHSLPISQLLEPLEEVINLPINLADFWMYSLISLDSIESRTVH